MYDQVSTYFSSVEQSRPQSWRIIIQVYEKNYCVVCHQKTKGDRFESVTRGILGFSKQLLVIVDLMYKTKYYLISKLNSIIKEERLKIIEHIREVVRWYVSYKEVRYRDGFEGVFYRTYSRRGNYKACYEIFRPICLDLRPMRATIAHLLWKVDAITSNLKNLKIEIESD